MKTINLTDALGKLKDYILDRLSWEVERLYT